MFRIIPMLHTKICQFIVKPTNNQYCRFVVHIQSLMKQGGWVRIIIYVLIKN